MVEQTWGALMLPLNESGATIIFKNEHSDNTLRMRMTMFKTFRRAFPRLFAGLLLTVSGLSRPAAQDSAPGGNSGGEGAVFLAAGGAGPYTMIERSDWSRYDNGRYTGHVYHEVRASIKPDRADKPEELPPFRRNGESSPPDFFMYRGNFFVLEETLRDMRASARPVDSIVPVSFRIYQDGTMLVEDDQGFPSLRGFPAFPAEAVSPGSRWTARGQRAVDPKNTGNPVLVPFVAEYQYRGPELYREIPVHRVSARYAVRYRDNGFGGNFSNLQGSHSVDILIQAANGLPLLIRDNLDETFSWPDGSTLRLRGFTLIFSEGAVPISRETIIASMGNSLGIIGKAEVEPEPRPGSGPGSEPGSGTGPEIVTEPDGVADKAAALVGGTSGLDLVSVPEGIRLIVRDIRFIPDSDEFLPEERPRLDIIAQALKEAAPRQNFLVEGHTAAVGRPTGEMELSISRARRMVEELARRGIAEDRFIYKGWGGTRPVGDNGNEQGRALNRRVEITILD
jgi:outer membrane protein OmpA-like peptidoglycan-associated protein